MPRGASPAFPCRHERVGILDDALRVGREEVGGDRDNALPRHGPHRDAGDVQFEAGPGGNGVALLVEESDERAAHVSAPEKADA